MVDGLGGERLGVLLPVSTLSPGACKILERKVNFKQHHHRVASDLLCVLRFTFQI